MHYGVFRNSGEGERGEWNGEGGEGEWNGEERGESGRGRGWERVEWRMIQGESGTEGREWESGLGKERGREGRGKGVEWR